MTIRLDKTLVLNAFRSGKDTADIAKMSDLPESKIYNMLIQAREKEYANRNKPTHTTKHEPPLARG